MLTSLISCSIHVRLTLYCLNCNRFTMKKYLLFFAVIIFYTPMTAQQGDSLAVSQMLVRAKDHLNKDAGNGKLVLDSIAKIISLPGHNEYQIADYQKTLAIYYYRIGLYDSSVHYYQQSREAFSKLGSVLDEAKILVNLSMTYNRLGDFDETIQMASDALRLFEQIGDQKGIAVSLNIMGQVYYFNEDYQKSLDYFRKYLAQAINSGDSMEIAGGYNNIGSAYMMLEKPDSAILIFHKALDIHLGLNSAYGIGNAYQNIASNYQELNRNDSAFYFYQKALPYYKSVDNKSGLAETYVNMGRTLSNDLQNWKAIDHFLEGISIAKLLGEKYLIQEGYYGLAASYEELGQYRDALNAYQDYDIISDSIFNESTRSNIEEINARYETEKKEQQIAMQQLEITNQQTENQRNLAIMAGLVVFIMLLIVTFMLYRNHRQRREAIMRQEAETRLRETQMEATVSSQEKERTRFARDLHDGFGQMIAMLNLNMRALEKGEKDRQEVFESSTRVLEHMYRELKSICFNLMPQTLINHGVVEAIRELVYRINESSEIRLETDFFGMETRLNEIQEISLYRIVQEWISNIIKHSDATWVTIQITKDEEEITLLIEDDGSGFDPELLFSGKGNGWRNMNARANLINGCLELETKKESKGSTLILNAPVSVEKHEESRVKIPS